MPIRRHAFLSFGALPSSARQGASAASSQGEAAKAATSAGNANAEAPVARAANTPAKAATAAPKGPANVPKPRFEPPPPRLQVHNSDTLVVAEMAAGRVALRSGHVVKVVEQVDDVVIFAAKRGESTIEIIADVSKQGDTLYLRGAHIQGSAPGKVGVKGLFDIARDLGRASNVERVVIEGGRRTTGVGNIRGSIPRPIEVLAR